MSKDIYSFYELVQSYSVKVPIIQRDYAQGRKRNVTICENFLKALKDSIVNDKTINLDFYTKNADILVVAIGKPNFIKRDSVKDGAVIIDVGINRMANGMLCGDVDFDDVKDKVSYITPVPGGVGQMTVSELALNTYKAHMLRKSK